MKHLPLRCLVCSLLALPLSGLVQFSAAQTGSAHGDAPRTDCSRIEDPQRRLACFDRQFPRDRVRNEAESVNTVPVDGSSKPVETATAEAAPIATTEPAATQSPATKEQSRPRRSLFSWPDATEAEFTSTIAAVRQQDKTKMVFRLANEQIWMQSSPRRLPIHKGDEVTISPGTVGGFILRTERGVATRVQRIE